MRILYILGIIYLLFACKKEDSVAQIIALPASLNTLKSQHPRLMLTNERVAELKNFSRQILF